MTNVTSPPSTVHHGLRWVLIAVAVAIGVLLIVGLAATTLGTSGTSTPTVPNVPHPTAPPQQPGDRCQLSGVGHPRPC